MSDDVKTTSAESSPAEPAKDVLSIPTNPEDYAEWRQSGKVPEKSSPKNREDSGASPSADSSSGKAAPVSETGTNHRQERTNAEGRVKELLADRATLRAELEALKAGKQDAKADPSPAPARHAASESSPDSEQQQRPVKPKQDDYDSWSKYEDAMDKYYENLADFKAQERIEERDRKARQEALSREMDDRLQEAGRRYGAEAQPKIIETAKSLFDDQKIPPAIKAALGRSGVLVDALYVMGSDQKEFSEFVDLAKRDPLEALRKWFTVESLVRQELGRAPTEASPRGPDGKFLPEKRKSAPAPPVELNGNTTSTGDLSERSANSGDFRSFKTERDRKDLLRHKGQS